MRVHELLNKAPLIAKIDAANAADTNHATDSSAHAILTEAAKEPYKARKPYKPYKPYTTESEADFTARKMRLKEFLLH